MRELILPGVRIKTDAAGTDGPLLMVLGGRDPAAGWLRELCFYSELWAVDKGIDLCLGSGVIPQRLIGDRDSADPKAWQWALDNGVPVDEYDRDKDLTDFQLSLDLISQKSGEKKVPVFLTGCFGGRFDHLWSTVVSFLHRSDRYVPVGMADDREGMFFLSGPDSLGLMFDKIPEAVSIIPFSEECGGVSVTGVRWPLSDVSLEYRDPYSISNRLEGGMEASVSVRSGRIGVYWEWRGVRDE